MRKEQKKTKAKEPKDYHVHFRPGTADWLRLQVNRDEPSVPAVVRAIVEAAQRRAEGKG